MDLSKTVFKNSSYKLVLAVYDRFNDYHQHCYTAVLKLYTLDNKLITSEKYSFSRLAEKYNNDHEKAYNSFFGHLSSRNDLLNVAYDLYCAAVNNKNDVALNL